MGYKRRLQRHVHRPPRMKKKDIFNSLDDDRVYSFADDNGRPLFQGLRLKGWQWKLWNKPFTLKNPDPCD